MEVDCILKRDITINSTWSTESGCKELKDAVKFSSGSSYDLEDVVQVESCVNLRCTTSTLVPCTLHVELYKNSNYAIKRVDIVSEARIIECYGSCEEYLGTVHGEYMDDFEGSTVYSVSSSLPSTQQVTLKFARMKQEKEMWLYGLLFTVELIKTPQMKIAGIDLSNVSSILKESRRPISDKAEHCRKLLAECGDNVDGDGAVDPRVLLEMFGGEYLQPLGENSKSMSKCLMRLIPFVMNKTSTDNKVAHNASVAEFPSPNPVAEDNATYSYSRVPSNNNNNTNIDKNFNLLSSHNNLEEYAKIMKVYVDKSISDMEEKITNRLEQRIKDMELVQSKKLDAIMKLLQERK